MTQQRGPTCYYYGPFVKAFEHEKGVNINCDVTSEDVGSHNTAHEDEGEQTIDDRLEAFLDSCDNDLEEDGIADEECDDNECDDENDDDYFYNTSTN